MITQSETLLIQSYPEGHRPEWIRSCLESAQSLAQKRGWAYHCMGDELFEPLPPSFVKQVSGRGPILSDLGRLLALRSELHRYPKVLWLDADVLIFNPDRFELPLGTFGFGRERWVQPKKKATGKTLRWSVHHSLCNALCYFERGNPFLDFYIYSSRSIIERADPNYIAPQMIGPKLLSALHSIANLPFTQCLGSASPDLLIDVVHGGGPALDRYRLEVDQNSPDAGLNLCQSLLGSMTYRGERLTAEHLLEAILLLKDRGVV